MYVDNLSIKDVEALKSVVQYIVWLRRKDHHDGWRAGIRILYLLGLRLCPKCDGQTTHLQQETAHESEGWVPCYHCHLTGVIPEEWEQTDDG